MSFRLVSWSRGHHIGPSIMALGLMVGSDIYGSYAGVRLLSFRTSLFLGADSKNLYTRLIQSFLKFIVTQKFDHTVDPYCCLVQQLGWVSEELQKRAQFSVQSCHTDTAQVLSRSHRICFVIVSSHTDRIQACHRKRPNQRW